MKSIFESFWLERLSKTWGGTLESDQPEGAGLKQAVYHILLLRILKYSDNNPKLLEYINPLYNALSWVKS